MGRGSPSPETVVPSKAGGPGFDGTAGIAKQGDLVPAVTRFAG
ncbi:hypothetical protein [Streptomyces sp. SLBN-118]|nr:hypothetical protein [Streptomyces sp. SLBN-118]